jgi:tRNA-modifying protein YgfZ
MPRTALWDRAVIRVTGEQARDFLNGLITCNMAHVSKDHAAFGALLSPQGKVLFDFLILQDGDDPHIFLLDCAKDHASALVERLIFYRLRTKITFTIDDRALPVAGWGNDPAPMSSVPDPRHLEMGWRMISDLTSSLSARDHLEDYHAHRISLKVPEGDKDFAFGEVFPHDVMMDVLNGVDFTKGCYVGQEVVSRMQHRGTARTRMVIVEYDREPVPKRGCEIMADGRMIGTTGSHIGLTGMAMVRMDKVQKALEQGNSLTANGFNLKVRA